MPVKMHLPISLSDPHSCSGAPCANPSAQCRERAARTLRIGLVNNMPDSALEATERQFQRLLNEASDDIPITLSLYALPGIERSEWATSQITQRYRSTDTLAGQRLDGLIVTGREPLAPHLSAEPYWDAFTRLVHWAEENTASTVWSCLAAHAVIYHLDGIERVKSPSKHFGVFPCTRTSDHSVMAGLPAVFRTPHSRWNGAPQQALERRGYRVLSTTPDAGVDIFLKEGRSLFVFLQGHPEYEADSLMLEYRRDVGRYLRGESDVYPAIPAGYFDYPTRNALLALEKQTLEKVRMAMFSEVTAITAQAILEKTWASTAKLLYGNWLRYLIANKPRYQAVPAPRLQSDIVSQITAKITFPIASPVAVTSR